MLTSTHRLDHTPVLQDLHWLPVKYRIDFRILLITFKALHYLAPPSLSDLLHRHTPTHCLRSADANLLHPIRTDLRSWGDRAFVAAAPALWKALPNTSAMPTRFHLSKLPLKIVSAILIET
jgi:hypothetical protein